jgi:hypothetical protein
MQVWTTWLIQPTGRVHQVVAVALGRDLGTAGGVGVPGIRKRAALVLLRVAAVQVDQQLQFGFAAFIWET